MHRLVESESLDVGPRERIRFRDASRFFSFAVSKTTYCALPCGSTSFKTSASEKPSQGMIIDQPSTQRCR